MARFRIFECSAARRFFLQRRSRQYANGALSRFTRTARPWRARPRSPSTSASKWATASPAILSRRAPRSRPSTVRPKHLLRMSPRSLCELSSAQHPCDFFGALVSGHLADAGACASAGFFFLDDVMMITEGGDLRQVGDAQDLVGAGQGFQLFPDGLSGAASDSGIDFIEDQRFLARFFARLAGGVRLPLLVAVWVRAGFNACFQRQHYPRQFSARGNVLQLP